MESLTIVSSCAGDYSRYLAEWASSIDDLRQRPGAVRLFTHGDEVCRIQGALAIGILQDRGFDARHAHDAKRLDFGTARNRAVEMAETEWVMHLDCDDQIMPHALEDFASIAPAADVIAAGYERSGDLASGPSNRRRLYSSTTGLQALEAAAPCSGVSPFRRSLWERSPYRTDMVGAWDTALWIGFARLGARFRPTKRPVFWYRQHADSVFNRRRKIIDWTHLITVAHLKSLRRADDGVAVIVPRDRKPGGDREFLWSRVRAHYRRYHPSWSIVEGFSDSGVWSKGEAISDALSRCSASILVVADADCLVAPEELERSVATVASRQAPWSVPHGRVLRLNRAKTAEALEALDRGQLASSIRVDVKSDLSRAVYDGFPGGGIFVVPRITYDATGGIPLVFRGWGGEDQAFAVILDTLAGKHARGTSDLIHLWHAPQTTKGQVTGNQMRCRRIREAAEMGPDALLRELGGAGTGRFAPTIGDRGFGSLEKRRYLDRNASPPTLGKVGPPKRNRG